MDGQLALCRRRLREVASASLLQKGRPYLSRVLIDAVVPAVPRVDCMSRFA
jgi:hypothetical protein